MSQIFNPPLKMLANLCARTEVTVEELTQPVAVRRYDVEGRKEKALEALRVLIPMPVRFKIATSVGFPSIFDGETYYIARPTPSGLEKEPWEFKDKASFTELVNLLKNGYLLTQRSEKGYVVLFTANEVDKLILSEDTSVLWRELCAAFLNSDIENAVRWSTRPDVKRYSQFFDVDNPIYMVNGVAVRQVIHDEIRDPKDLMPPEEYFVKVMEKALDEIINNVYEFVRQDDSALTIAYADNRGVCVVRYGNALLLVHALEKEKARALQEDLDQ